MSVGDQTHQGLVLSTVEVLGLTSLLWELGSGLKDTIGDPDCIAPELYREAARLEHEIGLPALPTDDATRETLAAYYEAVAESLEPGRAVERSANIELSGGRQLTLAQLIGRSLLYLGSEAIGSRVVNLSLRAVLWVRVLSETHLSNLPGSASGGVGEFNALQAQLRDAADLVRRPIEGDK